MKIPLQSRKDIWCSCHNFIKKKKCLHVYQFPKHTNKLDLIMVTLLRKKKKVGRPKKIKSRTSLQGEENFNFND